MGMHNLTHNVNNTKQTLLNKRASEKFNRSSEEFLTAIGKKKLFAEGVCMLLDFQVQGERLPRLGLRNCCLHKREDTANQQYLHIPTHARTHHKKYVNEKHDSAKQIMVISLP